MGAVGLEALLAADQPHDGALGDMAGALGPLVVSISVLGVVLAFFGRRVARGQVLTADA